VVAILLKVLENVLKLLHPFMPFITEEIYQRIVKSKTIMLEEWPKADPEKIDQTVDAEMNINMEVIRAIRNLRAEMNIPHSKEIELFIASEKSLNESYLKHLTKTAGIKPGKGEGKGVRVKVENVEIFVPLEGLIDFEKEKARLNKEAEKLRSEIQKLKNFPSAAPSQAIESARAKEQEFKVRVQLLEERLASL
jgi:valyl-tRNA synthetase